MKPAITSPRKHSEDQNEVYRLRILLLGKETGKTSLIHRYINNSFDHTYLPTFEDDFVVKWNKHPNLRRSNTYIKVIFKDISCADEYQDQLNKYLRWADAFILTFDVTLPHTFEYLNELLERIRYVNNIQRVPMVLCGTKCT